MIRRRLRDGLREAQMTSGGWQIEFKAEPVLFGEKGDVFYGTLHRYNKSMCSVPDSGRSSG